MSTSERVRDRGAKRARQLSESVGDELREARLMAGLSQAFVARAAGLAQSRVSRTERAARPAPRVNELAVHGAVLGLRLSLKAYPDGQPVRDEAQLKLLRRLRSVVDPTFRWRSEVPVGDDGDLRAWDVVLDGPGVVAIDAETRLRDVQALQRRVELKRRDSDMPVVVLVVASTNHNRRVLRLHGRALADTFPLSVRETLASLRAGRVPRDSGIAIL